MRRTNGFFYDVCTFCPRTCSVGMLMLDRVATFRTFDAANEFVQDAGNFSQRENGYIPETVRIFKFAFGIHENEAEEIYTYAFDRITMTYYLIDVKKKNEG